MPDTLKLVIVLPTLVKRNKERKKNERANFSKLGLANGYQGLVYIGGSLYVRACCGFASLES